MIIIISCRQSMSSTIFNKISTQFQKKNLSSQLYTGLYSGFSSELILRISSTTSGRRSTSSVHIHSHTHALSPSLSCTISGSSSTSSATSRLWRNSNSSQCLGSRPPTPTAKLLAPRSRLGGWPNVWFKFSKVSTTIISYCAFGLFKISTKNPL